MSDYSQTFVDDSDIAVVRAFNRTVTQRTGVLGESYLSQLPLGEARVLWETGDKGCDVRTLRARLGLDSGYLSRLLRSLESKGLVRVAGRQDDRRVRHVSLTKRGRLQRRQLDRRSDAVAESMLDGLSAGSRDRLVASMREVTRLLTIGAVDVAVVDPETGDARWCLTQYFAELDRRFGSGFDPAASLPADAADMRAPAGLFVLARLHGQPVACGALKFHGPAATELKRMWVAPEARGLGLGRRILTELEQRAAAHGTTVIRLETNGSLTEAIALYRTAGYREVAPFNDERYADHWFEKQLTTPV
jgi:DNA-binding MarR family transcriptional regulator/predicted GNAT family N-acyltransferase